MAFLISIVRAIFFTTLLLLLTGCTAMSWDIHIEPMIVQGSVGAMTGDTGKISYKSDYYIVDNFANSKKVIDSLSRFAEQNKDLSFDTYDRYGVVFYKTSWNTRLEDVRRHPGYADRYYDQDDLVLIVRWHKGKFYNRSLYDEAELNKVVIEDL